MTKKEKTLLTKVLCELLPYEVKYKDAHGYKEVLDIWSPGFHTALNTIIGGGRPSLYLRPMSSMTEEEKKYYNIIKCSICPDEADDYAGFIEWLNERHFDYRGLIEKGLAIAAVGYDNPYKEKGGEI